MPYAAEALTDEILGCSIIANHWIGWQGTDGAFIIDLGEACNITFIEADFLYQLGTWALLPPKVTYSVSGDNKKYKTFGSVEMEEERSSLLLYKGARCEVPEPVKARYIKVEFEGVKTCPSWHFGVGHPSWTYISEVIVQ
ncbi:MAG: discoidin domain-containing protein [Tannerellaceae bacterium]|nr:discoidin domain-containing protein [Tannerellaceae bacterium]MCD8265248.1 discoidin domain-containing protein [Tannerellaceae bacterium]